MEQESYLFDMNPYTSEAAAKKFIAAENPLWTKNKAQFIARYLRTFTYVTRHGTYIDAFAGPQHIETSEESWAAKLVVENKPAWLRNFYLVDKDPKKFPYLNELRTNYLNTVENPNSRQFEIVKGDCNVALPEFLNENPIREKEATFCLLDQRTTECDWETVKTVAGHKGSDGGHKIEIFYFLAQGWLNRAIKSRTVEVEDRSRKFWGNDQLNEFLKLDSTNRGVALSERFKNELGYKFAYAYPIQEEGENGRVMFFMVHASDHPRAPDLMWQAYRHVGAGGGIADPIKQVEFDGFLTPPETSQGTA